MESEKSFTRCAIKTVKSPNPIGPYSQAVKVGKTLYISGNVGVDPTTHKFAGPDIQSQTRQTMTNIQQILEEAGMTLSNVVKTTLLLDDINDFVKANEVYATFFSPPYPARAAYEVARLPESAKIEIEAIAIVDPKE